MKNRKITLHDGRTAVINDDEWRSVVNRKHYDDEHTEIVRVTRHLYNGLVHVYAMRGADGTMAAEHRDIVLPGGDVKSAVVAAIEACDLGAAIAGEALAAL